jgi:hypothetical protein
MSVPATDVLGWFDASPIARENLRRAQAIRVQVRELEPSYRPVPLWESEQAEPGAPWEGSP